MKNKIPVVLFAALFSSAAFAKAPVNKTDSVKDLDARTVMLEKQIHALQNEVDSMKARGTKKKSAEVTTYHPDLHTLVELYAHGPAVVTSPALGVRRTDESGSGLMATLPSINEDLVLLQIRQKMDNYSKENNISIPERPIIALSGAAAGQVLSGKDFARKDLTDVNLSSAELDVVGEVSPWITAAFTLEYDDAQMSGYSRIDNSRIQLGRGWVTIGQLNKFPLYLSFGQLNAPFGSYGSDMISDSLTKFLGKFKDRMIVLGGYYEGFTAQAYGYAGDIKGNDLLDRGGFNLGYDFSVEKFKVSVGAGILGNLAETNNMYKNIFGKSFSNNERVNHGVAGVNGRVKVQYLPFTLRAEYVGALRRFDTADIKFNNDGAKPQAIHVEGAYEFDLFGKPHNFAVGYGHSWDALALGMSKDMAFAEYDVSWFHNTIFSLEYRHDIDYGKSDFAAYRGMDLAKPQPQGTGRHANKVTAEFTVFF